MQLRGCPSRSRQPAMPCLPAAATSGSGSARCQPRLALLLVTAQLPSRVRTAVTAVASAAAQAQGHAQIPAPAASQLLLLRSQVMQQAPQQRLGQLEAYPARWSSPGKASAQPAGHKQAPGRTCPAGRQQARLQCGTSGSSRPGCCRMSPCCCPTCHQCAVAQQASFPAGQAQQSLPLPAVALRPRQQHTCTQACLQVPRGPAAGAPPLAQTSSGGSHRWSSPPC